jgi:HK97 gp10 family phage protein
MRINTKINAATALAALKRSKGVMDSQVRRSVNKSAHLVARSAKNKAPQATGLLTRSIQVNQVNNFKAEIFAGANYAEAVEQGVSPRQARPGTQHIIPWAKSKGVLPTAKLKDPKNKSIAFAIITKIKRRGLKPQPFLIPAYKENEPQVRALMGRGVKTAIKRSGL